MKRVMMTKSNKILALLIILITASLTRGGVNDVLFDESIAFSSNRTGRYTSHSISFPREMKPGSTYNISLTNEDNFPYEVVYYDNQGNITSTNGDFTGEGFVNETSLLPGTSLTVTVEIYKCTEQDVSDSRRISVKKNESTAVSLEVYAYILEDKGNCWSDGFLPLPIHGVVLGIITCMLFSIHRKKYN